jgi:hypothetical protein
LLKFSSNDTCQSQDGSIFVRCITDLVDFTLPNQSMWQYVQYVDRYIQPVENFTTQTNTGFYIYHPLQMLKTDLILNLFLRNFLHAQLPKYTGTYVVPIF